MPPQTLQQRVSRLVSDALTKPDTDIRGRWGTIADTVGADCARELGPIPDADLWDVPLDTAIQYSAADADATLRLNPILDARIEELGLRRALEIDYAVVPMITQMTLNGMLVDLDHLSVLNEIFEETIADLERRCHSAAGREFLVSSPDQVAEILYTDLALPGRRRTKKGKRLTTDEKALQGLKGLHPIVTLLLEHREVCKLQSSYVEKLPQLISDDGRWRYELGLTTIPSGRLNGWGGVNPLAIPVRSELGKEIRRAFKAPESNVIASVDLSQIEMKAMAIISGDERMLEAFSTGADIHTQTAQLMFHVKEPTQEQRHHGKQVGFGIINGITAMGLLDQMILRGAEDWDEVQCQRLIDSYLTDAYPGVARMFESTWSEGRQNGYIRCSLSGRILWCPGLRSPIGKVKSEAERVATNWKIQTWAQTVMKLGMAQVWEYIGGADGDVRPLLQIHDELVVEAPDALDDADWGVLAEVLCSGHTDIIPITAGWRCGPTWADASK